jgi:hypothetical protein
VLALGAGVASMVVSRDEQAAKMLVKADAGFLGHTGGIGIQGPKKIADLLLDLRTAQWRDRWLDLTVHFRL